MKLSFTAVLTALSTACSVTGKAFRLDHNDGCHVSGGRYDSRFEVQKFNVADGDFKEVSLPGWVPTLDFIHRAVIVGYTGLEDRYDAKTWAEYVLDHCKQSAACTTTYTYSGINSELGRFWFGYLFRENITVDDLELAPAEKGVRDIRVFSLSE